MASHAGTSAIHRGQDLSTINEHSPNRGRTKSPEPHASDIETHDCKDESTGPKRRSTHPQISFGPGSEIPSVDGDPRLTRSATSKPRAARKESSFHKIRQILVSKVAGSNEGIVPNRQPRRQSTFNTNASVTTNASASFEDTAVWDQKALLALGTIENLL